MNTKLPERDEIEAMLPWFAGLVVVAPIVGHASWHAYRAAVA